MPLNPHCTHLCLNSRCIFHQRLISCFSQLSCRSSKQHLHRSCIHRQGQFTQPDRQRLIVQTAVSLNMVGSSNKQLGNKRNTQIQFSAVELCSFSWFLTWINLLLPANYSQSARVKKKIGLFSLNWRDIPCVNCTPPACIRPVMHHFS